MRETEAGIELFAGVSSIKTLERQAREGYVEAMVSQDPETPEPLQYTILGEDDTSAAEKLEKFTGVVGWKYLAPHFLSGVLYFVDPGLELVDVGLAFSENRKEQVEGWLKAGDLVKIGDLHAEQWEKGDTEFEALVVSPFVLCRPVQGDGDHSVA